MRPKADRVDRLPRPELPREGSVASAADARAAVAERCEAHRRWVADDGDVACRGID
jgi:hypothetical protein